MKRQPIEKRYKYISRVTPLLFWKKCEICGLEFCRELLWRLNLAYWDGIPYHEYICKDCANNEHQAGIFWKNRYPKAFGKFNDYN